LKTVMSYVEIGKNEGAKLLTGGNRLDGGMYAKGLVSRADSFWRLLAQNAHRAGRNLRPGGFGDSHRKSGTRRGCCEWRSIRIVGITFTRGT